MQTRTGADLSLYGLSATGTCTEKTSCRLKTPPVSTGSTGARYISRRRLSMTCRVPPHGTSRALARFPLSVLWKYTAAYCRRVTSLPQSHTPRTSAPQARKPFSSSLAYTPCVLQHQHSIHNRSHAGRKKTRRRRLLVGSTKRRTCRQPTRSTSPTPQNAKYVVVSMPICLGFRQRQPRSSTGFVAKCHCQADFRQHGRVSSPRISTARACTVFRPPCPLLLFCLAVRPFSGRNRPRQEGARGG